MKLKNKKRIAIFSLSLSVGLHSASYAYTAGGGSDNVDRNNIVIGQNSWAGVNPDPNIIAQDPEHNTEAGSAVVIGTQSAATATNVVAVGSKVRALSVDGVAIGLKTTTTTPGSTSIGPYSSVHGTYGQALGFVSYVGGFGSAAIGSFSSANEDWVVSFGSKPGDIIGHAENENDGLQYTTSTGVYRRLINVADGINNQDATTVGQLLREVRPDNGNYVQII